MGAKSEFSEILRLVQKISAIDEELEKNILNVPDDDREKIVAKQISRMRTVCKMLNQKYSQFDNQADAYRDRKAAIKTQKLNDIQIREQIKGTVWSEEHS